ncbi:MAG: hypothetical protein WC010_00795 [Candidatus Absconditabacterales bacterium]
MENKIKEKSELFRDRIFQKFSEIFKYRITSILLLSLEYATISILIISLVDDQKDSFPLYGYFFIVLSGFYYGQMYQSCKSYIKSGGEYKYRKRATRSFLIGIISFLISVFYLLLMYLLDK